MSEESPTLSLTCPADGAGKRLDAFLAYTISGWSRSGLQRLIENEDVLVNELPAKASYRLREGDQVDVELVDVPAASFEPEDIPLDIVYEDEHLAVINKPAGLVVHPGAGVHSGTLANAIAFHFGLEGNVENNRVGIVHRLDKDTSGLIVVAKNQQVQEALSEQFRARSVTKRYIALVHGFMEQDSGTIDAPIARHKHNRLRMRVAPYGRSALTLWSVRERFTKFTLLGVEIRTGRTHQIRVHMAYINHPVVGDPIYNEGRDNTVADPQVRASIASLGRFFLHAERLAFIHPISGQFIDLKSSMPEELTGLLDVLREDAA